MIRKGIFLACLQYINTDVHELRMLILKTITQLN